LPGLDTSQPRHEGHSGIRVVSGYMMHVSGQDAVIVRGLSKRYGSVEALVGSTVAVLGPNGAGKTTFLEILEGFRARDGGHVAVLGRDPATADATFRE